MIVWLILLVFILALAAFAVLYLKLNPQFGGRYSSAYAKIYKRSPQWDGKKFNNTSKTVMNVNLKTLPGILKEQYKNRKVKAPQKPIKILPFDADAFSAQKEKPKFIWYGHSVLLLQINGKNILIDPMFGDDAAPIAPFDSKRFSDQTLAIIDTLPQIDAIFLTHDHYDHLDYASIKKLRSKVDTYYVALGMARHLIRWKIPEEQITEFDWWEEKDFDNIKVAFTPTRHFSGRGSMDRAKSLWGGWVFITENHRIYWSGDSGYDAHFKEVGQKYGPFDWGFMECGQYNERWHYIHMFPEESVQAALDANVKTAIPVHWAGFTLAMHPWTEPVERFINKAENTQLYVCTPAPGEVVILGDTLKKASWWKNN